MCYFGHDKWKISVKTSLPSSRTTFPSTIFNHHRNTTNPPLFGLYFEFLRTFLLRTIRNHPAVARVLNSTRGRLTHYPWGVQDPDTVSVCFLVGVIPQYQSEDSFVTFLKKKIGQTCPTMRIPKFKCVQSRISANSPGQISVTCQAFDIQTRRADTPKLAELLRQTCPAD
jgi:hypothetical protein